MSNAPKNLSFENARKEGLLLEQWRGEVRRTLRSLLGAEPQRVPLNIRIESRTEGDEFDEIRFVFTSEANVDVPCHLLLPKERIAALPVMVCLQGHSTGMHISLGRAKFPGDEKSINGGDRDFALQVVRQGWAALVLEQRCFGERLDQRDSKFREHGTRCIHASLAALLVGRTMLGERVWDVSRAIDALTEFPEIDPLRIGCMGNSGGGTVTYYAACMDERISIAMPSCSVCTIKDSIGSIDHCADNYVPGILNHFEMGDLAVLIAPRPLIVVTGREDVIFPIQAVGETFDLISRIYQVAEAPGNCALIIGEEGHRFYAAQSWPVFQRLSGW